MYEVHGTLSGLHRKGTEQERTFHKGSTLSLAQSYIKVWEYYSNSIWWCTLLSVGVSRKDYNTGTYNGARYGTRITFLRVRTMAIHVVKSVTQNILHTSL